MIKDNNLPLFLKYRPSKLSELVGHRNFVETIKKSASMNRFSNAYLLCGKKGSGKTSSARILANVMTCEGFSDGKTCGDCISCKRARNGGSIDIIEVDGAKQRKAEEISVLIENASWTPRELSKKIIIIDEAHQLSSTAISSLLKIVEEPPEYLVFIFCTTEYDKIPDTIISRTQRFIFKSISSGDIFSRLKHVSGEENIKIGDKAIISLAKLARGSLRDALVYLEQIGTIADGRSINENSINKYFGIIDRKGIYELVLSMINGEYSSILDKCNDIILGGVDIKGALYEISEVFRSIMVIKIQGEDSKVVDLPDYEIKKISQIGKLISISDINLLSSEFSSVDRELKYSLNKRLILESTLIKCSAKLQINK